MDQMLIRGGNKLNGEIEISGAKNAALPLLAISLLTDSPLTLTDVPCVADIATMLDLLAFLGVNLQISGREFRQACLSSLAMNRSVTIQANNLVSYEAPYDIVRKMRASIWVLGPLVARFGYAKVSQPGGCAIGVRQVDLHIDVLRAMGANIDLEGGYITARTAKKLKAIDYNFPKISVGATITAIMAATLAEGVSHFSNCAREPEIIDICNCLNKMGAIIKNIGSSTIEVIGVDRLSGTTHHIIPDRIEAGTYMIAAAITGGKIKLNNIDYFALEDLTLNLQKIGIICRHEKNMMLVESTGEKLKSIDISTQPFPGFATDLQAQFMSLMTIADGTSLIIENIFENRFMHVLELNRLGANITTNGSSAIVRGVETLKGAPVMATDLRASVALVLAGLCADGITTINRIYHLDRGYNNLEAKLKACGADIQRIA